MKIQVYLDGVTGERLVALADLESRSVSSMARLLIERAVAPGEPLKPRTVPVVEKPRVPPEVPPVHRSEGRGYQPPEAARSETADETVQRLQRTVPGVRTASVAFPSVPQDLARQVTPRPRSG